MELCFSASAGSCRNQVAVSVTMAGDPNTAGLLSFEKAFHQSADSPLASSVHPAYSAAAGESLIDG